MLPTLVPAGLTYAELFRTINEAAFLDASFTVIPDTFLGIYSAALTTQLRMPSQNCFISSALWPRSGIHGGRRRRRHPGGKATAGHLRRRRLSDDGAGIVDHGKDEHERRRHRGRQRPLRL
ncbi:hypothetical protein MES4922_10041 [Mesorhizobium ventifaucium]|uniref:Uncharacterized protein n=1 Tax=Mesorhizobium ventifaucium TaxID=666020 RepID=A0ABM9DEC7_9HYPH|nr:hypothetical protein MES4922_10041 [Mesorhizobium ventifaucium]